MGGEVALRLRGPGTGRQGSGSPDEKGGQWRGDRWRGGNDGQERLLEHVAGVSGAVRRRWEAALPLLPATPLDAVRLPENQITKGALNELRVAGLDAVPGRGDQSGLPGVLVQERGVHRRQIGDVPLADIRLHVKLIKPLVLALRGHHKLQRHGKRRKVTVIR